MRAVVSAASRSQSVECPAFLGMAEACFATIRIPLSSAGSPSSAGHARPAASFHLLAGFVVGLQISQKILRLRLVLDAGECHLRAFHDGLRAFDIFKEG